MEQQEEIVCPKCGSEEFDIVRWSVNQGVDVYDTYCECHCGHQWSYEE
jgi:DNA-directed RNA polymerase subunit M/transcription elongation factor TFIIS